MRLAKHAVDSAIKKTKSDRTKTGLFKDWLKLKQYTRQIEQHIEQASNKFTFKFFEGALTKSIVNGDWVILDEINLASSETLQFLGTLLDDEDSSIVLYEKG
jgi:midasin